MRGQVRGSYLFIWLLYTPRDCRLFLLWMFSLSHHQTPRPRLLSISPLAVCKPRAHLARIIEKKYARTL